MTKPSTSTKQRGKGNDAAGLAAAAAKRQDQALVWFKAVADANRLRLLMAIRDAPDATIGDLVDARSNVASLSQPTISHHMGILLRTGLITKEKRGVFSHLNVTQDGETVLAFVDSIV